MPLRFLKSLSTFEICLWLYIGLFGLHGILQLPLLGDKLQVSDLLFPFLALSFYRENKGNFDRIPRPLWPLLCFGLILDLGLLSSIINYRPESLIESLARYYLFALGAMTFIHFYFKEERFRFTFFRSSFSAAAVLAGLTGLTGILLTAAGIENRAALFYPEFPYLGDTYRLTAFFASPNMLVLHIGLALSFLLEDHKHKYSKIAIFILALTCFFTFAKGLILLIPLLMIKVVKIKKTLVKTVLWSLAAISFLLLSHLQFKTIDGNPNTIYGSDDIVYRSNNIQVLKTSYTTNKETALLAFRSAPFLGLGSGNYNQFVDRQKEAGNYPLHYYSYDPHSTWFGLLAEQGILAFLAFLVLVIYLLINIPSQKSPLNKAIVPFFLLLLIESITMDMLNFRFLYILIGLLFLQIESGRKKQNSLQ